jgi:DnaJ-class molecular chaperone
MKEKQAPLPIAVELAEDVLRFLRAKAAAVRAAKPGALCPACHGTGRNETCRMVLCSVCDGTGVQPRTYDAKQRDALRRVT